VRLSHKVSSEFTIVELIFIVLGRDLDAKLVVFVDVNRIICIDLFTCLATVKFNKGISVLIE
jgi:hypothetical protein